MSKFTDYVVNTLRASLVKQHHLSCASTSTAASLSRRLPRCEREPNTPQQEAQPRDLRRLLPAAAATGST